MLNNGNDVVIVSAVRTPFGRYGGSLKDIDFYDLGALPMREVISRVKVSPDVVDGVFWGVGDTSPCKEAFTPVPARQSLLKAGLPYKTVSTSFDMACVSAMHAIELASVYIRLGEMDALIVGGATSFSQEPLIVRGLRFSGHRLGDVKMEDPLVGLGFKDYKPVSVESDDVAAEYGIGRQEQDEWALRSHVNYGTAWNAGKFKDEIMPLILPKANGEPKILDIDEQYRPETSLEKLAKLKTIYGTRAITAGNAPGMNDGATAILLMRRKKAEELSLDCLATVISQASIAIQPSRMPEGPAFAIQKALKKASLRLDDIAVIEINEAFACVPLISTKLLSRDDAKKLQQIRDKTNINGSAIAIGHPNTASGARIVMNLMYELRRRGGGYAMGAICGGLSQACATIIKV
jgi:acetyl-CoA C-acetyltransferase